MFAEERKREILRLLNEQGKVRNLELSQMFSVSEPTIRRDISELDEQKLLIRTHGGAISIHISEGEPTFIEKSDQYHDEKSTIGEQAAALVKDNDIVILDSGTTTVEIARRLQAKHITVITNSLDVAAVLESNSQCELIVTGGIMRWNTRAMVGAITDRALAGFHADIAFVGANGVSEKGFSTPSMMEGETKASMLKSADKKFIVSDSSKIGKTHLSVFASMADVDGLITDQGVDEKFLAYCESKDLDVIMKAGEKIDFDSNTESGN